MASISNPFETDEVGYMRLQRVPVGQLSAGEGGYLFASIRQVGDTRTGEALRGSSASFR